MARDQLIWIDSPSYAEFRWPSGPISRFRVGDVEFRCGFGESHDGDFAIRKDRVRIEEYLEIVERFDGDNVVELGIRLWRQRGPGYAGHPASEARRC